ncbi:MAG: efflux transporter periplasmic adaptor subunit, partial [Rhizobiales bacterium]|nr:efflux transporter periplasmic adaptor subunit [Hyphomicrobiales bacterium]
MSLTRQIVIVLCLLAALGAGVHWFWDETGSDGADAATGGGRRPVLVETVPAERTTLARKVEAVGTTRARQSVDIRPAASGRVIEILFSPGRLVEEGNALARLDATSEEADVAEAR